MNNLIFNNNLKFKNNLVGQTLKVKLLICSCMTHTIHWQHRCQKYLFHISGWLAALFHFVSCMLWQLWHPILNMDWSIKQILYILYMCLIFYVELHDNQYENLYFIIYIVYSSKHQNITLGRFCNPWKHPHATS